MLIIYDSFLLQFLAGDTLLAPVFMYTHILKHTYQTFALTQTTFKAKHYLKQDTLGNNPPLPQNSSVTQDSSKMLIDTPAGAKRLYKVRSILSDTPAGMPMLRWRNAGSGAASSSASRSRPGG